MLVSENQKFFTTPPPGNEFWQTKLITDFSMKERIKQLMEAQHMNQQTFSNMTGISTASLSSIFNGRTKPTLMHVEAIRNKFPNINLAWLLYGEGGMFTPAQSPTPLQSQGNSEALPAEQSTVSFAEEPLSSTGSVQPTKTDILAEGMLDFGESPAPQPTAQNVSRRPHSTSQSQVHQPSFIVQSTPKRRISEIHVYYDDQTYEVFLPKK